MPKKNKIYKCTATLSRFDGSAAYHYLEIPLEIAEELISKSGKRVLIQIFDQQYRRAIQNKKTGLRYVFIGKQVMNELGLMVGAILDIEIWADPNPDDLDLPSELVEALNQDEPAHKRFYAFPPGSQRSLAHYVKTAKRTETRVKRSLELARKLRTHTLYSDLHPDKK